MKAISLWQPWASLIASGAKQIETRSWYTGYRGPLAIHASKRRVKSELIELARDTNYIAALGAKPDEALQKLMDLPLGAIVAVVNMSGCYSVEAVGVPSGLGEEYWLGNYDFGRYAWILTDVRPLSEPIPFKGAQGFFDVPDELLGVQVIRSE